MLLTVSAGAFILFVSDDPDGDLVRHGEVATCGKDRGGPSLRLEVETEDFLCVVLKFSLNEMEEDSSTILDGEISGIRFEVGYKTRNLYYIS